MSDDRCTNSPAPQLSCIDCFDCTFLGPSHANDVHWTEVNSTERYGPFPSLSCPWGVHSDLLDNVFFWLGWQPSVTIWSQWCHCLRDGEKSSLWQKKKRRKEMFFLVILVFTPVIWTPVVCKGRLFFKEGKMCAQLDTFIGELLPGLERSHFYLMLMFYYYFIIYFILLFYRCICEDGWCF